MHLGKGAHRQAHCCLRSTEARAICHLHSAQSLEFHLLTTGHQQWQHAGKLLWRMSSSNLDFWTRHVPLVGVHFVNVIIMQLVTPDYFNFAQDCVHDLRLSITSVFSVFRGCTMHLSPKPSYKHAFWALHD